MERDKELHDSLSEWITSDLEGSNRFLVGVYIPSTRARTKKIVATIDGQVSVADCAHLSRLLSRRLNTAYPDEEYMLEVSTPGLDAPLQMKQQYVKNRGRRLRIVRRDSEPLEGVLVDVADEEVSIDQTIGKKERHTVTIRFDHIEKAFVQPSFNKLT